MSGCAFLHTGTEQRSIQIRTVISDTPAKKKKYEKNYVPDTFWRETFLQMTARNLLSELNFEINI